MKQIYRDMPVDQRHEAACHILGLAIAQLFKSEDSARVSSLPVALLNRSPYIRDLWSHAQPVAEDNNCNCFCGNTMTTAAATKLIRCPTFNVLSFPGTRATTSGQKTSAPYCSASQSHCTLLPWIECPNNQPNNLSDY